MKITSIQASAGRTFNHPHEPYANFRFDIHLKAEIAPEDQEPQFVDVCVRELQDQAERLADERKAAILERCELVQKCETLRYEITRLSRERQPWEKESDPEMEASVLKQQAERKAAFQAELRELLPKLGLPTADEPCLHPGHPEHPETHERD